jgi:anti-anti-sigma factor
VRANQYAAPLVVVRSEAEPGRVGLRLIGELDLNTVEVLEAELAHAREQSPPAVIDLSELRFLDMIGLRALLRAGQLDGALSTRLVGATGIVRRLIDLTRALDAEIVGAARSPLASELSTTVTEESSAAGARAVEDVPVNGKRHRTTASNRHGKSRGAALTRNVDAS